MPGQTCSICRDAVFPTPMTMAFQPVADLYRGGVFAYEALVRGRDGAGAFAVLRDVTTQNRHAFDQACRAQALGLAARLGACGGGALLSINFLPNAVHDPAACMASTVAAASALSLPLDRLMFEFCEGEPVPQDHLGRIIAAYKALGVKTAIDDFGAGYSGLNLLAKFQPDVVKLDMALVRDIDRDRVKRALVRGVASICREIGVEVVAEGIETAGERDALLDLGVWLQQGYLFARPAFEALPEVAASARLDDSAREAA
jgi:EAL domain-containing protein (putative c-di-GMP-specific phosphodiesterase class I)